jgi:MFS family permease
VNPLRDARFRRLYFGQAISAFGSRSLWLAAGMWVLQLTDSYPASGLVFLALGLPGLLGPVAGTIVDRAASRRRLMIIVNLGMAAALLLLLAVHSASQLWLIYAVMALYGFAGSLISAARGAFQRDLLADDQLARGNALQTTTTQGIGVIGPLVGAALFAAYGGHSLVILDATTFGVAAVLLGTISIVESAPNPRAPVPYLLEVTAGFRHIASVPTLGRAMFMVAIGFCVIGFADTTQFAVVREGLGRPVSFLGVLTTAQGLGAIIGGLVVVALMRRIGTTRMLGLSLLCFGCGAALTMARLTGLVLCGVLLDGVAVTWLIVPAVTAVQRHTPRHLQGRANAAAELMITAPQQASIALGAMLIAVADYRVLIGTTTVVMLSCAAVLLTTSTAEPEPVPASPPAPSVASHPGSDQLRKRR